MQVGQASVGAGAQEDDIYRDVARRGDRHHAVDVPRLGHQRLKRAQIDRFPPYVARIRVRVQPVRHRRIGGGDGVGDDHAGLGADLGSHAAQRHARRQRHQLGQVELHGHVAGARRAQDARQLQDHIFGADAGRQGARGIDADGRRHAQPGLPGGQGHGHVGRAHAGAEGGHAAVERGVRIGADDHRPRRHQVLLHHHLVADAAPGVEEVGDALLAGEAAQRGLALGHLHGGGRRHVVDEQRHALGIVHPRRAHGLHGAVDAAHDGVVRHGHGHLHHHHVAGGGRLPGRAGEDLLREGLGLPVLGCLVGLSHLSSSYISVGVSGMRRRSYGSCAKCGRARRRPAGVGRPLL